MKTWDEMMKVEGEMNTYEDGEMKRKDEMKTNLRRTDLAQKRGKSCEKHKKRMKKVEDEKKIEMNKVVKMR